MEPPLKDPLHEGCGTGLISNSQVHNYALLIDNSSGVATIEATAPVKFQP